MIRKVYKKKGAIAPSFAKEYFKRLIPFYNIWISPM